MQSNVSASCSSAQLGSWEAREEARKSWEYVLDDECVYLAHPFDVNTEIAHIFTEKYLLNKLWFHVRWTQLNSGQTGNHDNEALIEHVSFNKSRNAFRKSDSAIAAVDRDRAMFIEVPEFVELPERFCLQGICSVVRLKRIQSAVNAGMKQGAFRPVGGVSSTDREHNLLGDLFCGRSGLIEQIHQVPSELIERSAEAVDEVSDRKSDFLGSGSRSDYKKVLRSVRIILFAHGVRVTVDPVAKAFLSRLEVKVSPSGFHVDILN
jgi:hypothetical protein